MAKVHYFQRYSSAENTVTNNTLQLISRIYAYAPQRAADLINELVDADEPVEIGLEIQQQQQHSVGALPDGAIIQRSFKILLETKVGAPVNEDQLVRHSKGFGSESHKILILLTKRPIGHLEESIRRRMAAESPNVIFKCVTFDDVIRATDGLFQDYEYEMTELIADFVDYCWETGLVDRSDYRMRIVPCGLTLEMNLEHGIYFHPSDRNVSPHRYLGIYKDKTVQGLWRVDSVFDVTLTDGILSKELVEGRQADEYDDRIRSIIAAAKSGAGYEISQNHRFYCGIPHRTEYVKTSPGGMRGSRYVDLEDVIGSFTDAADIAEKLRGRTWS